MCCAAVTPILTEEPGPGSLLARVAGTGTLPLAVGRSVRLATPAQRRALRIRAGGCGTAAAYTEPHHVTPFSLGGQTDLDAMVSLCWAHHRLTELGRFIFTRRRPGDQQPPGALAHPSTGSCPRSLSTAEARRHRPRPGGPTACPRPPGRARPISALAGPAWPGSPRRSMARHPNGGTKG